ncbi:MAG: anti-sigma factor antagonist [Planctomycetes bacterium]|nr:anti-sigma factor antagonist [Planctomycetota bacterium]
MADLSFQVQPIDGVDRGVVVSMTGAIDAGTVVAFQDQLDTLRNRQGFIRFVLDLDGVKYVNSTGLGSLVKLADGLEAQGGGVALIKIHPKVRVVFDMLGLNTFFQIYRSLDQALEFVRGLAGASSPPPPPPPAPAAASPATGREKKETLSPGSAPPAPPVPAAADQGYAQPEVMERISPEKPRIFACQGSGCGAQLKFGKAGKYKCPRCSIVFVVSEYGEVTYPTMEALLSAAPPPAPSPSASSGPAAAGPPAIPVPAGAGTAAASSGATGGLGENGALVLRLYCRDECLEGLMAFSQAIAKRIGFEKERIREIQMAIHDAVRTIARMAFDDADTATVEVRIYQDEGAFRIRIEDRGRTISTNGAVTFSRARQMMDRFEHSGNGDAGNVVEMTKGL